MAIITKSAQPSAAVMRPNNARKKNEHEHKENREQTAHPSAATVERYLKGAVFPAEKNDLLERAEENDAPEGVIWLLEQLDEIEYKSPIEIAKQIGKVQPARRGGPSAAVVERYLKGIEFFAYKDDILDRAEKNSAPAEIISLLEQIEDQEYRSPIDISKEIGRLQPSPRRRIRRSNGGPSAATVEHYLKGIEFPANKDVLLDQAEENDAPEDVMKLLDQIEAKEYNSPIDISKEIGRIKPRRSGGPSAATVEHYFKGVSFPMNKDDLIREAETRNAPDEVMCILEQFEDSEYRSPIDIAKQIGRVKQSES